MTYLATTNNRPSFEQWLLKQAPRQRKDPVGKLAQAVKAAREREPGEPEAVEAIIARYAASNSKVRAASEAAWREYGRLSDAQG